MPVAFFVPGVERLESKGFQVLGAAATYDA